MLTYLDFDLLLEHTGSGYRARIIKCPAGEGTVEFALPFSDLELENFVLRMGQARRGVRRMESPETEAARAFGAKLFNAVISGIVQDSYNCGLAAAQEQGMGLRLRLRLADVPELADVPWEYLYDPRDDHFLALSAETPIVRYLELPERIRPLAVTPPLRILVLIASPQGVPALDTARERANLEAALADLQARGQVVIEFLPTPTLAALQAHLRRSDFQVFHFIGHGAFDETVQSGVLLLEDATCLAHAVSGQDLGTLLHDERSLRLAVLNACEGARTSRTDPFAGTAQSLVKQGVPAVIAMQFAISDVAAITFTREFYGALADGYPVDAALAEARKAIFALGTGVEWGTPVLYLRAADGQIFKVQPPPAEPATPTLTEPAKPAAPVPPATPTEAPSPVTPAPKPALRLPGCSLTVNFAIALVATFLVLGGAFAAYQGMARPQATPVALIFTPTRPIQVILSPSPVALVFTPTRLAPVIPSPSPEPSATAVATQIAPKTPTPTATASPSPTPRATVCAGVDAELKRAFDQAIAVGLNLGCPAGRASAVAQAAMQEYRANPTDVNPQNRYLGLMIWRGDTREIHVVSGEDVRAARATWALYEDLWVDGMTPESSACAKLKAPAGYEMPLRGFGTIWCTHRLWETLGWPTEPEQSGSLRIQAMQNGWLFKIAASGRAYLIAADRDARQATTIVTSP